MESNEPEIRKILLISLSNIGDIILTFPVIDVLKETFPAARLSVVVGPKARFLFENNPHINETYVFDKQDMILNKMSWILKLRKEKFDLVVDLRNTAIPFMISPKFRTPLEISKSQEIIHKKMQHLRRLKKIIDFSKESEEKYSLAPSDKEKAHVDSILKGYVNENETLIVVAAGAANNIKRWMRDGFAELCDRLVKEKGAKVVLVGDSSDQEFLATITWKMEQKILDLAGQTTLVQLAELIKRSHLVISNDSAVMHMASYLNKPVFAIFGPTDPRKYGPWCSNYHVARKDIPCAPCEKSGCDQNHECMKMITSEEILSVINFNADKTVSFSK